MTLDEEVKKIGIQNDLHEWDAGVDSETCLESLRKYLKQQLVPPVTLDKENEPEDKAVSKSSHLAKHNIISIPHRRTATVQRPVLLQFQQMLFSKAFIGGARNISDFTRC